MNRLMEAYRTHKLIPFVGAGLSVPFDLPEWGELIHMIIKEDGSYYKMVTEIKQLLHNHRYWDAITLIQKQSEALKCETDIQKKVSQLLRAKNEELERTGYQVDNNYRDLLSLDFKNYLSFNYDYNLEGVAEANQVNVITSLLQNKTLDTQFLANKTSDIVHIWHVHGELFNPGSITLSSESYEELYSDSKFAGNLQFFINHFVFLFSGVSFQDVYVKAFFEKNKDLFCRNTHYIMFGEHEIIEHEKELEVKYGLRVIRYSTGNGHTAGIRAKLKELFGGDAMEKKEHEIMTNGTAISINAKNAPVLTGNHNHLYFS